MRLTVVAVGRWKSGPERALFEHYAGRVTFPFELLEVGEKKPLPDAQRIRREGELLLARIPERARVVALDEKGKSLDSTAFAALLRDWRDDGVRDAAFVIGGAGGLDSSVLERAELKWSLGRATWPHMLVRGLVAEQVYRAQCIMLGHPYHRN